MALAAEFTRAVARAPLLPPQLLPRPWIGAAARAATAACCAELARHDPVPSIRLFRWYAGAIPLGHTRSDERVPRRQCTGRTGERCAFGRAVESRAARIELPYRRQVEPVT